MTKAVISSTYDDLYLFNLPIVTWLWNKLEVDVICFMPTKYFGFPEHSDKIKLLVDTVKKGKLRIDIYWFECPKHKEATYTQCARLYAACLDLPEDEILVTSDVDMAIFKIPPHDGNITIFGSDLVPNGQYPMCYSIGTVKQWREVIGQGTYQEHLDNLLGLIEADHFRGNYWGKDQETMWNLLQGYNHKLVSRARAEIQFATCRVDRDDVNWRIYVDENLVDAHLWRPGYSDENFAKIMELLTMKYPNDDFDWVVNYKNEYLKL